MKPPASGVHRCATMLAALLLLGSSRAAIAGEWQLTPDTKLTSGYTGNPRFLTQPAEDEVQGGAEVGLLLSGGSERFHVDATPRATFSRYRSDRSLDTDNQYLGLTTSLQGELVQWSGSAQLSRDTTQTSELGTTGLVQDNRRRESVLLAGGPRWTVSETLSTGMNLQWNDVRYGKAPGSGLADYSRSSASVFGAFTSSDRSRYTLTAQGGRLEAASRSGATHDAGLTLGFSHTLNPSWSWSLSAGPSWADSGATTDIGTLFTANVTRQGERLQLAAELSRKLDPVGSGYLSQADAFALTAARALTEKVSLSLSGRATRNRELLREATDAGRETRYCTATTALSWAFTRAWTLSLSVEGRSQEVTTASRTAGAAEGYRAWLGIGWNGRTLTL